MVFEMEYKKRSSYYSGPSRVLSIPSDVVKHLEQHYGPMEKLIFDLKVKDDTLTWVVKKKGEKRG